VLQQHGDVFPAIAQRGHVDGDDIEPVVEVTAELALVAQLAQRLLGGLLRPETTPARCHCYPDARAFSLAEREELDLHGERHVLDLVQEQRAVVSVLELSDSALVGSRKRSGFVAEDLAVEHGLGDGAAS
jgi:hypothetical protein